MTRQEANKSLKLCTCMHKPEIQDDWDTFQVICGYCGKKGKVYWNGYYNEEPAFDTYGECAVKDWNENYSYEAGRKRL